MVQLIAAAGQRTSGGHGRDEVREVERGHGESQPVTRLQQLLPLLPPGQRRVIELRFGIGGDECSPERVAELLDVSPRHVRTLEREALRRLRQSTSPAELRSAA